MESQSIHCPNCGGAVESDKTQCEFCNARLKTVACPACLGLMFLGSKYCDHCGRKASSVETLPNDKGGECPRCRRKLESLRIDATEVRECLGCGGFWMTPPTFESLCADKDEQSAVLGYINKQSFESRSSSPISYVPCPDCKQLMNRSNFARSSGVIIDLCKQHGVWFDADELQKIIDFIDKGGLVRSREKEKMALEEERSRLRDEQRKLALMERRSGGARDVGFFEPVSAGGDVLSVLFDLTDF